MNIFRNIFNKKFKFFATSLFGMCVFACCANMAYAKGEKTKPKVNVKSETNNKNNKDKENKNKKDKEAKSKVNVKSNAKKDDKDKDKEKDDKDKEKDDKDKEKDDKDNEKNSKPDVSKRTQDIIDEYKKGNIDTWYFFDKKFAEDENKSKEKEFDDACYLSYKLKTNFESSNINNVAGIVLWQAILNKICKSKIWNDEKHAVSRDLENMMKFEQSSIPNVSHFDDLNSYLKNRLYTETWYSVVVAKMEMNKGKDGKSYPYFTDMTNCVADSFNIEARKYCEELLAKSPEKAAEEVVSQAKEATRYFIKRYESKINLENYKKDKKKLLELNIKNYRDKLNYLNKRLDFLKNCKEKNDFSEFKNFIKHKILPYAENEKKKTEKWVETLNKSKKAAENKNLEEWFDHSLDTVNNININEALVTSFRRIISNEDKLKKYFESCLKDAEQQSAAMKNILKKSKEELKALENPAKVNAQGLTKEDERIIESNKGEMKKLKLWLKEIDKVDKDKLKDLLRNLRPVELVFLGGESEPAKR